MDRLMIRTAPPPMDAAVTRVGGLPLQPRGAEWPRCARCGEPMQFLLQLRLSDAGPQFDDEDLLCVWQCNSDPGGCESWNPASGANRAAIVDTGELVVLDAATPPLARVEGVSFRDGERSADPDVIGILTTRPDWVQEAETVRCEGCFRDMTPVLQLECHAGGGINFGDLGCGYALACARCRQAAWLWQCH